MKRRTRQYLRRGLFIDAALVLLATIGIVVESAITYDGQCGSALLEPKHTPCSLWQYIDTELFIILNVMIFFLWWAILLVLLGLPLIGYLIDRRVNERS